MSIYDEIDKLHKAVVLFPNYNELRIAAAQSLMLDILQKRLIEPIGMAEVAVLRKLARRMGLQWRAVRR